ncbi:hypothetical protein MOE21_13040 [Bacillus atrophaeus]|uniref:hypothetical protein n=1 Tax=Bacillus atrophaeus TaxID=1452 RepID=UPI002282AF88|nr:hypothetical protein [Bacillus atrophaeus]MCY8933552.1 hypothetical protein [Bacillus atrophaeus]
MQETIEDGQLLPFCGGIGVILYQKSAFMWRKRSFSLPQMHLDWWRFTPACWRGDIGYGSGFTIFGEIFRL